MSDNIEARRKALASLMIYRTAPSASDAFVRKALRRAMSPALRAIRARSAATIDVRAMPCGFRAYTKLMPAAIHVLRADRGLGDRQPVSLAFISILEHAA